MEEYMLPCMHKKLWGIDCIGCGTQRAAYMVTQGEFVSAFKMFPAIYFSGKAKASAFTIFN